MENFPVPLLCHFCAKMCQNMQVVAKKKPRYTDILTVYRGFILVDGKELESELNNDISNKNAVAVY